jgi:hypothetical protein
MSADERGRPRKGGPQVIGHDDAPDSSPPSSRRSPRSIPGRPARSNARTSQSAGPSASPRNSARTAFNLDQWCSLAPSGVHSWFHSRCTYCQRPAFTREIA